MVPETFLDSLVYKKPDSFEVVEFKKEWLEQIHVEIRLTRCLNCWQYQPYPSAHIPEFGLFICDFKSILTKPYD